MKTEFYIRVTSSKLLSFFIAISSAVYGLVTKDGNNMVAGFGISAGLYANKQYQDRKESLINKKKEDE